MREEQARHQHVNDQGADMLPRRLIIEPTTGQNEADQGYNDYFVHGLERSVRQLEEESSGHGKEKMLAAEGQGM